MKKVKSIGLLLVILALLVSACGGGAATPVATEGPQATSPAEGPATETSGSGGAGNTPAASGDQTPIKIGLFLPMTGALAFIGEGYQLGIDLAIKDLGGAIAGHPIETYVADNKGNPTDSVNAVRQLVDVNEVHAIIGGAASSATMAGIPVIAESQVPTVDGSSTNPTIYNQLGAGGNPYLFRISPDDLIMGQGFGEYIANEVDSIAFVGDDNQFGRGAGQVYVPLLPKVGVEVVSEDYFDPATADFRPALTAIKSTGAEGILIVMTDQSCATFMRQFREVGLDMKVYSRGSCTTGLFNELTQDDPSIGEGIIAFSFFTEGMDPELDKHFFEEYNKPITSHRMAGYYAMYYALAPAIQAVIESGQELTHDNIRDAIAALDVQTPSGPIKFDDHNQAYTNGSLNTNKDGVPVLLDTVELEPVDHTGY